MRNRCSICSLDFQLRTRWHLALEAARRHRVRVRVAFAYGVCLQSNAIGFPDQSRHRFSATSVGCFKSPIDLYSRQTRITRTESTFGRCRAQYHAAAAEEMWETPWIPCLRGLRRFLETALNENRGGRRSIDTLDPRSPPPPQQQQRLQP